MIPIIVFRAYRTRASRRYSVLKALLHRICSRSAKFLPDPARPEKIAKSWRERHSGTKHGPVTPLCTSLKHYKGLRLSLIGKVCSPPPPCQSNPSNRREKKKKKHKPKQNLTPTIAETIQYASITFIHRTIYLFPNSQTVELPIHMYW